MSEKIPLPVKRILRKEAGFGCCICGHPFIEYHHVVPYAELLHHNPDEMMILCPNHHHQATVGALDQDTQRKYKENPYNLTRGYADGQLVIPSRTLAVEAGSNQFVGAGFKFIVDGEPVLQLRSDGEGRLLVSLDLYDQDDHLLLAVMDNEWITGDPLPWDFEFGYNTLKLRKKEKQISLFIDARQNPVQIGGELWRKGQQFELAPDHLIFNGVVKQCGFANLGLVGLSLVADTAKGTFSISPDPKFGQGAFVSWPDPGERLQRGLETYRNFIRKMGVGRNDPCPCGSGRKAKRCCLR